MRLEAHAKINWTLEVLGLRADGYHELKSVVLPIGLHDVVEISEASDLDASLFPYGEKDLAYRAAKKLREKTGCEKGAAIKIEKRIPAGGGLGGGSADAAAVLTGLNEFWSLALTEEQLLEIAAEVGSDVPALLLGGPVMMEGRGERVRRLTAEELVTYRVPDPKAVEVMTPPIFSSTPAVYREFRDSDRGLGRNDLEPAALRLYPEISAALETLRKRGLKDVALSGSGSSVYGIAAEI